MRSHSAWMILVFVLGACSGTDSGAPLVGGQSAKMGGSGDTTDGVSDDLQSGSDAKPDMLSSPDSSREGSTVYSKPSEPDCQSNRVAIRGTFGGEVLSVDIPKSDKRYPWGSQLSPDQFVWFNASEDFPEEDLARELGIPDPDGTALGLHVDIGGTTTIEDIKNGTSNPFSNVLGGWLRLPSGRGMSTHRICGGKSSFVRDGVTLGAGVYSISGTICETEEAFTLCVNTVR